MIQISDTTDSIHVQALREDAESVASRLRLEGNVTVRIGSRDESHELNLRYRGIDAPTDVLSFPIGEEFPDGFYCGDIHICLPVAREQAVSAGHSLAQELRTLVVHGLLHLAGYDHEKDDGEMMRLQDEALAELPPIPGEGNPG